MLKITVPEREAFDESTNEFIYIKEQTLCFEHSLVSLSKWESKWCKPFLSNIKEKTVEEALDYFRCMCITQNVKPEVFNFLTEENIKDLNDYINQPMTATWFRDDEKGSSREIITAEIIYYWMINFNIPFECQKWHLNRLLTLIRVCSIKSQPPKKMSRSEAMSRNRALNEARKAAAHSHG